MSTGLFKLVEHRDTRTGEPDRVFHRYEPASVAEICAVLLEQGAEKVVHQSLPLVHSKHFQRRGVYLVFRIEEEKP